MRLSSLTLLVVLAAPAWAKPWNGIEPGVSTRAMVVKRFGEPSRVVKGSDGREVLAYLQKQAIKGTVQAQFKLDATNKLVERIDVFPAPVIDKESIEGTYGAACPSGAKSSANPCYVKRLTDDFRTYFHYASLGLAIFFNEDGKSVHSFIFQPEKKENES